MKTCRRGLHQFDNSVRRGCGECKKTRDDADRHANPEKHNAKSVRWRAAHPGVAAAYTAAYRAAHPGKASAYSAKRRKDNPEWAKERDAEANARRRGKLFGVTAAEFKERQSRPCEICGNFDERPRAMHVDHDHTTGKIRGTLCHNCNVSIGLMKESQERLLSAIQYIERYA